MQIRDIHLYVTSNAPLFGPGRLNELFICQPSEAIAFFGLYQRLRGTLWTLQRGWPTGESSAWTSHLLTRALVPELRDVLNRHGSSEFPRAAWSLLGSARVRLERVLIDRDYLIAHHLVSGRRLPYASAEELLEHIAMNLSGLFDAIARAINIALSFGLRSRDCAFHRSDFRSKLPSVVKSVADEPQFQAMLDVIKILRNTIHHEALGAGSASDQKRKNAPLAMVPFTEVADFLEAVTTLRRTSRWVLQLPGSLDLEDLGLGVYALPAAEDLLAFAVGNARAILGAVPWPGATTVREPGYWETSEVLEQLARLYGLTHLSVFE